MFPLRGEALSRTLEAEEVLSVLYAEAIDTWVTDVTPFVLPSLTAATTLPPDPSAIVQERSGLDRLLDELILSGLSTLFCLAFLEALEGLGLPLPEMPDIGVPELVSLGPTVHPSVIRSFTENTSVTRREISAAVRRVYNDPYLAQQADDFVETQRELVHTTPALLEAKVAKVSRDANQNVEAATPISTETPVPTMEVVIERQREAVAVMMTPGSQDLLDVARLQSYQAAGVQNAAVVQAAGLSTDVLDKTWIATLDGKTRDSHFAADGQRTPLAGTFTVGTAQLRWPGDDQGPAEEVRNCRCRVGVLAPGEEIPTEVDRHTERLDGRDSTAVNRAGSQQDEIARRADDGVIRAREDADGIGRTAAGGWTAPSEQEYGMTVRNTEQGGSTATLEVEDDNELFYTFTDQPVGFIGIVTSDGRMLSKDIELTVRTPPLPAMWCKQTNYGHLEAYTVGVGESARIEGDKIVASGYWLNTDEANESFATASRKVSRPSVDLAATEWMLTDENGKEITEEEWWDLPIDATVIQCITKAELIGFTMVATPAFGDTMIEFNTEKESRSAALVASAAEEFQPRVYPAANFRRSPEQYLAEPTEIQMDPDTGRIFGHLACFGSCHRSIQAECVVAPRSPSEYAQFHTSPSVRLDDGTRVAVGRLTVGTGHAPDTVSGAAAMAHYDNTGTCFALVRAFETPVGIEVTGVAAPWATAEQIEMGLAAPLSGDWRDFGMGLDLIAALAVNTPGFAVRGREDALGRPVALVASLGVPRGKRRDDVQLTAESIAAIVAKSVRAALDQRDTAAEVDALVATAVEKVGPPPAPEPPKTPNDEIAEMLAQAAL